MEIQLLGSAEVYREKFKMESVMGSNDTFALVGKGIFVFESSEGKYEVKENEGAVFRRDVLYNRKVIEPVTLYLFRYRASFPVFKSDHVVFRDIKRIRSTIDMLEKIKRDISKNEFDLRRHLFLDMAYQYVLENENIYISKKGDALIEAAIKNIKEGIGQKIPLIEIAEKTGLSYIQFLRRFKAYTGMSPSDYVSTLRLKKSQSILSDTELPIKDIAALCGFENEYYFSNFFKKKMGMSPSVFRKFQN
jgi:AraC-like DNA-binding protein